MRVERYLSLLRARGSTTRLKCRRLLAGHKASSFAALLIALIVNAIDYSLRCYFLLDFLAFLVGFFTLDAGFFADFFFLDFVAFGSA